MVLKLLIAVYCFSVCSALENDRYYPRYHLAPGKGWMNDPNGFCVFNNEYHLFYQHNPFSSLVPGTALWAHVTSKDLFHWKDRGIALQNDSTYDRDGVFSGSAVIDSDVMYLFYTGHVNHRGQTPNQTEVQALATSKDGVHFTKYKQNSVIDGKDLQPNIRDPKVWKHGNYFYMVLGNSFIGEDGQQLGRVLLFRSSDKINWTQVSILDESDGYLGYMWECPDFFEINGHFVLLFSPQGVKPAGDKYRNLYQTGYIVGHFDYKTYLFTPYTEFRELDHGHDFYATQTILDNNGRRLLVGWMDMWETSYPEAKDGFTGQMTIFRSLSLTQDYRLKQKPVKEVVLARGNLLYSGCPSSNGKTIVPLVNKTGDVLIIGPNTQDLTVYIGTKTSFVEIKYEYLKGRVSLKRDDSADGYRRTRYRPLIKLALRIFIDASSIEVFFGDGDVTFSSRFFVDSPIHVRLGEGSKVDVLTVYDMKTTLYND